MSDISSLIRPLIRELHGYVPGEQPKIPGLIKLNTNENPYPPSPKVLKVIKAAVDERLRLYPNPTADRLREKLAAFHRCSPDNIIVGNGSDELLALATRVFVEPGKDTIQYFTPSYSLYPVLADIHGALKNPIPLNPDFTMPSVDQLRQGGKWNFDAALTYITSPNAPTGRACATADLERLSHAHRRVLILDEAYVNFADEDVLTLALKFPHVIVARTFSKGYALCFLRVGYFVGHPELIAALHKARDSYNVNGLGQIAAEATLDNVNYYRKNFRRIRKTREHIVTEIAKLGFETVPSQTNFIFTRPPHFPAGEWFERLRGEKILVRWWNYPEVRDYLRITIGAEKEMEMFLKVVRRLLKPSSQHAKRRCRK
jgi:histidinol-phosphate aminotransferase